MTKRYLLIDFLGWYQRNTQEEGTCNEKWMDEATVDSYLNQPQLQQHGVMQAEGSEGEHVCKYCGVSTTQLDDECYAKPSAEGASVGNSAAGQSGSVGCIHNTLKYIGPWYSCETCGTHFNARAEAPPEGALPF